MHGPDYYTLRYSGLDFPVVPGPGIKVSGFCGSGFQSGSFRSSFVVHFGSSRSSRHRYERACVGRAGGATRRPYTRSVDRKL